MEKYKIYNSNMTLLFYLGYVTIKENEFGTLKFVTQNEVIRKVYSDYFLEYIKRKAQIITSTIDTEKIIEELQKIALESGAKKVRLLNTAGPFHTEKLEKASEALRNDLEKIKFKKASSKVFKNIDGTEYTESNDMPDMLAKHIISPVKFTKVLKSMYDDGIDTFVEIGPGKTLSGFVKRMNFDKDVLILNINNVESLESTIDYLKKEEI